MISEKDFISTAMGLRTQAVVTESKYFSRRSESRKAKGADLLP